MSRLALRLLCALVVAATLLGLTGCLEPSPMPEQVAYRVRPGDTLHSLARRFGTNPEQLRSDNRIADPRKLEVGQLLAVRVPERQAGHDRSIETVSKARQLRVALRWPVRGGERGSPFGRRGLRFHEGLDIRAPQGTAVLAAHSGVVVYSSSGMAGFGKTVIIRGDGYATLYAHNSRLRVDVGDVVAPGAHIADVGRTGRATGPHLHFELRVRQSNGLYRALDPEPFFARSIRSSGAD